MSELFKEPERRKAARLAVNRYKDFMALKATPKELVDALEGRNGEKRLGNWGHDYRQCTKALLAELYAMGDLNDAIFHRFNKTRR